MNLRTLFGSRIERRVAIPLIFALTLPVLGVSMLAMEVLRQSTIESFEARLQRSAKDYGMLVLERLNREFEQELSVYYTAPNPEYAQPKLRIDANQNLIIGVNDEFSGVPFSNLIADVNEIEEVQRCVAINDPSACFVDPKHELYQTWPLRLISQFDTSDVIYVTVSHNKKLALKNTDLIARVMPFVIALVAALVGYGAVLYLRRRFRPVPDLQHAIKKIEQGHFGEKVVIESNDEFALLGDALNSLSEELNSTFGFREIISEIDEKILAGAQPVKIFADICRAACDFVPTDKAFVVMPSHVGEHNVVGLCDGKEEQAQEPFTPDQKLPELEGIYDGCNAFPILSEQSTWGWLLIDGEIADEARFEELVRKASVAATNYNRSKALFEQATYDGLTGLLNRAAFAHELERMLSQIQRNDGLGALIFLDLDQFKRINDTEGHTVGDELLCIVAERLNSCVREADLVARLGGDEFAIGLPSVQDNHDLVAFLRRILNAISIPMQVGKFEHAMCCSMGVCLLPQDGDTTEELLKNADLAMYKAKAEPGSTFAFFDATLNLETERRVLLEGKLREALAENQLQGYLQPKVDLRSGRTDTFEALVRWTDEQLGTVSPNEFVDIAERAGLIEPLTESMVAQVSKLLARYPAELVQRVAVNLSPAELMVPGFEHKFLNMLRKHNCDFNRLEVEVTESIFVANPEAAKDKLTALRDHGIKVSLDDFGTGFSSLNLIMHLPLDALKIDKSFVDNIVSDNQTAIVVAKIVEMATSLGIEVIAEGVENHLQIALLKKMGCTHLQGYAVSPPLTEDALAEFVGGQMSELQSSAI